MKCILCRAQVFAYYPNDSRKDGDETMIERVGRGEFTTHNCPKLKEFALH